MKKLTLLLLIVSFSAQAQIKIPKEVTKARNSIVSIITYKNGVLNGNGTGVITGENGEILASSTIFLNSDSAIAIGTDGKIMPIMRIAGVNGTLDCLKAHLKQGKRLPAISPSLSTVNVGEELYLISYGVKNSGIIEPVRVASVDSVYSYPYYTVEKPKIEQNVALPLVNVKGEFVAVMQPSLASDTIYNYAVGASVLQSLEVTAMNYGKGFFPGMKIRSSLPEDKKEAVSALYMQTIIGDSVSYKNTINDFINKYPKANEGYLSRAEFSAVYNRNMDAAERDWCKAADLSEKPADVFFTKGKIIYSIVQSGDTLSHPMLTFEKALAEVDKAIQNDNQPIYINYKADMLYNNGEYEKAYEYYRLLSGSNLASPDIFAKAAQCKMSLKEYDNAIEMLDSAINFYSEENMHHASPFILTRALLNMSAKKYRNAVIDYNRYEEIMGYNQNSDFYYMRFQAELKAKMYQQALNDIDRAIYEDESNVTYYIEKGMLCYRVKYAEEGIRAMLKAKELVPNAPDVYYLLGRLYQQIGESDNAKEALEKAISLGHDDAENQLKTINENK